MEFRVGMWFYMGWWEDGWWVKTNKGRSNEDLSENISGRRKASTVSVVKWGQAHSAKGNEARKCSEWARESEATLIFIRNAVSHGRLSTGQAWPSEGFKRIALATVLQQGWKQVDLLSGASLQYAAEKEQNESGKVDWRELVSLEMLQEQESVRLFMYTRYTQIWDMRRWSIKSVPRFSPKWLEKWAELGRLQAHLWLDGRDSSSRKMHVRDYIWDKWHLSKHPSREV